MPEKTTDYTNVHSQAVDLANGQPVGTGEVVKLTDKQVDDAHNALHIEEGRLVLTPQPDKPAKEEGGK